MTGTGAYGAHYISNDEGFCWFWQAAFANTGTGFGKLHGKYTVPGRG